MYCYATKAIWRKDIDEKDPIPWLVVALREDFGKSMRVGLDQRALVLNLYQKKELSVIRIFYKEEQRIPVKLVLNNQKLEDEGPMAELHHIEDFKTFEFYQDYIILGTRSGRIEIHRFDFMFNSSEFISADTIDLQEQNREVLWTIDVSKDHQYVLVGTRCCLQSEFYAKRVILLKYWGSGVQVLKDFDLFENWDFFGKRVRYFNGICFYGTKISYNLVVVGMSFDKRNADLVVFGFDGYKNRFDVLEVDGERVQSWKGFGGVLRLHADSDLIYGVDKRGQLLRFGLFGDK